MQRGEEWLGKQNKTLSASLGNRHLRDCLVFPGDIEDSPASAILVSHFTVEDADTHRVKELPHSQESQHMEKQSNQPQLM